MTSPGAKSPLAWIEEDERFVGLVLVLAVLVSAGYGLFRGAFHFDDFHNLVENENVRTLANIPRFFTDASTWSAEPGNTMFRPLQMTSYALDFALWGYRPTGWILTNTLLHAAVVLLIWRLARRLGLSPLASLLAGFVAALHPANTEVVNYVSSRSESLAAALLLGALHLHLSAARAMGGRRAALIVASALMSMLALGAKETVALYFAAVLVLELVRPTRTTSSALELRAGIALGIASVVAAAKLSPAVIAIPFVGIELPGALVVVVVGGIGIAAVARGLLGNRVRSAMAPVAAYTLALLVVMLIRSSMLAHATAPVPLLATPSGADPRAGGTISVLDNLLKTQTRVVVLYLQVLLRPVQLNIDYDVARSFVWTASAAVALGIHAAVVAWALAALRAGRRLFPLCVGWFWLFLAPSIAFPLNVVMNEHRLYLPGIAVALLSGAALGRVAELLAGRFGTVRGAAIAAAPLALFVPLDVQRSMEWRNDETLWTVAVERAPLSARAHMHLGAAFHAQHASLTPGTGAELLERAIAEYRISERLFPGSYDTQLNLGSAYLDLGYIDGDKSRFAAALDAFREAGRIVGETAVRPRYFQAVALAELGRHDEAIAMMRDIQAGDATETTMYDDFIGHTLRLKGDKAGAAASMEKVIAIEEPIGRVGGLLDLAWWRFEDGDVGGAKALLDRALKVSNDNVKAGRPASFLPYLYAARMLHRLGMRGPEADGFVELARKVGWAASPEEVRWVAGGATPGAMRRGTRGMPTYGAPRK